MKTETVKTFTRTLDVLTITALVVDIEKQEFLNCKYDVVGIDPDDITGLKAYVSRHNPGKLVSDKISVVSAEQQKFECTLEDFLKVAKRVNK